MNKNLLVKCPTCQKEIPYHHDNPFRPFCSERCKLIDLGAWAAEEHVISEPCYTEELLEELDLTAEETTHFH